MDDTLSDIVLLESPTSERREQGPIERTMRERIGELKDSSYVDQFDWGVYDRIARRFGSNPPRGGVVFKTTFKLANHHATCSKCLYAFEIDTYGRGCVHNCHYCYAKEQLSNHGFWNRPIPFPVDLAEVRKIMYTVFETDRPSRWRPILSAKTPVRLGSMSDSFMLIDRRYGVTKELLRILNHYDYPHLIFTRSDLVADDEYLKLLRRDLCSVQMSICGNNELLTRQMEPGAPSVARRMAALKKVATAGLWTTVRINPLFPLFPDGYFTDPATIEQRFGSKELAPKFDLWDAGLLDQIREAGVKTVLAGFVRLSSHAIRAVSEATSINLASFFSPDQVAKKGDKRYTDAEIRYYYEWLKREATARNLRFTTCYIGNGLKDYFQYQNLWSNSSDCCDTAGNVQAFQSSSQSIPWPERMRHSPDNAAAERARQAEAEAEIEYGGN